MAVSLTQLCTALFEPVDQEVSMAPPGAKEKKSLANFFKLSTVTSGNTLTQQERI